jgi:hypothetical protein
MTSVRFTMQSARFTMQSARFTMPAARFTMPSDERGIPSDERGIRVCCKGGSLANKRLNAHVISNALSTWPVTRPYQSRRSPEQIFRLKTEGKRPKTCLSPTEVRKDSMNSNCCTLHQNIIEKRFTRVHSHLISSCRDFPTQGSRDSNAVRQAVALHNFIHNWR